MSSTTVTSPAPARAAAVPKADFDWKPLALLGAVLLLAWPLVGTSSTWVTLSVAGLAPGPRPGSPAPSRATTVASKGLR